MIERIAKIGTLVGAWACFMVIPMFVIGTPQWLASIALSGGLALMATSLLAFLIFRASKGQ